MDGRRSLALAVIALQLWGCTTAAPKQAEQAPQATGSAGEGPFEPEEPSTDERLLAAVRSALTAQGVKLEQPAPRVFLVALKAVPQGYTKLIAAVADYQLFLFATGDDPGAVKLVAQADGAMVNMAKLELYSNPTGIKVWSQYPFKATAVTANLAWDGSNLKLVDSETVDPSASYFAKRADLLQKGDLDGLIALAAKDMPLYPNSYMDYYTQAAPVLRLAYQKALDRYHGGDLKGALSYLQFGIHEYGGVYDDLLTPSGRGWSAEHQQDQIPEADQVPILNDYAFFLAESGQNKEAEPLLLRVIKAAPDRTVAYLNAGDVEWALGKHDAARPYYQKYLDLLGPDRSKAPPRVAERLK